MEQNTALEPGVLDPRVVGVLNEKNSDPGMPTGPTPDTGVLTEEDMGPNPEVTVKVEQQPARTETTNLGTKPLDDVSVTFENFFVKSYLGSSEQQK